MDVRVGVVAERVVGRGGEDVGAVGFRRRCVSSMAGRAWLVWIQGEELDMDLVSVEEVKEERGAYFEGLLRGFCFWVFELMEWRFLKSGMRFWAHFGSQSISEVLFSSFSLSSYWALWLLEIQYLGGKLTKYSIVVRVPASSITIIKQTRRGAGNAGTSKPPSPASTSLVFEFPE